MDGGDVAAGEFVGLGFLAQGVAGERPRAGAVLALRGNAGGVDEVQVPFGFGGQAMR